MSLFDDFNDFLNREEKAKEQATLAKKHSLLLARQEFDFLLRHTFSLIREYYTSILSPRREMFLVFKKDTDIAEKKETLFLHRVNFIAQDSVPLGIDLRYVANPYLQPQKITPHDWHSNVALQVTLSLKEREEDSYVLVFDCLVWGNIESRFPARADLRLIAHEKNHLPYTHVTFETDNPRDQQFLLLVEEVLTAVTNNVLDHRKIVWGES